MKKYMQENAPRLVFAALVVVLAMAGVFPDMASAGAIAMVPLMVGDINLGDVKKLLEDQGRAWEEFKKANDEALKAGNKDAAEVKEKLGKINADLDRLGTALKDVEIRTQRLVLEGGGGTKDGLTPEQREHKEAFVLYMRKGKEDGLKDLEVKAMSVGSDPDGGYFVTPDTSGRIIQKIFETSPMRQYAAVQGISTDALEGPNDLNDGVIGGWVGETAARSTSATPQVGKYRIPVHEMYAQPEITQSLLDDSAVDVEAWLAAKVADKMGRTETTAFFTGTGVGQPRGILTYTTAATADGSRAWGVFEHVATGTSGGYGTAPNGSDKLIDLIHKCKAPYRAGSAFWMNKAVLGTTRQLKDSSGAYIWLPASAQASTLAGTPPSTLLGYPVIEAEDMPALGANSLSVGFGNMSLTYQIVDRIGIRVLRDPFTNKPFIRFYTTRRVGGDALHFETFKFLKFI